MANHSVETRDRLCYGLFKHTLNEDCPQMAECMKLLRHFRIMFLNALDMMTSNNSAVLVLPATTQGAVLKQKCSFIPNSYQLL